MKAGVFIPCNMTPLFFTLAGVPRPTNVRAFVPHILFDCFVYRGYPWGNFSIQP
jgi:hypothetical protein